MIRLWPCQPWPLWALTCWAFVKEERLIGHLRRFKSQAVRENKYLIKGDVLYRPGSSVLYTEISLCIFFQQAAFFFQEWKKTLSHQSCSRESQRLKLLYFLLFCIWKRFSLIVGKAGEHTRTGKHEDDGKHCLILIIKNSVTCVHNLPLTSVYKCLYFFMHLLFARERVVCCSFVDFSFSWHDYSLASPEAILRDKRKTYETFSSLHY